ncbi:MULTISPECIES: AbrB/MazE/SpoVT family DNA-binding domain-containing protein [Thermococcus]|uniref:Transcriptional regulator, AbrB family protein n=1 Tax=Thermococcus nautili TaxID=195522 RepID=W8NT92_9EURY|nr:MULTISPECIES: AbrB/MazE/SpoVT family DNA-binding domain-containing protein [Thermococcus]AHL22473.1 transcriptional regulator, AbrB family protein [Thermococcus nautili]EEB73197.1 transcriptional regulator AbrB family [Thermococcus sp. AM4]NJE53665.1 AbrB/MazE/SpoVT family DNA-binding domain-containing protein [Thermococcus sp. 21S9]
MPVVTKKYQVTIPKEVREALGIKAGDEVVFVREGNRYVLMKLTDLLKELSEITSDIDETVEEVRQGLARGIERSLRELEGEE